MLRTVVCAVAILTTWPSQISAQAGPTNDELVATAKAKELDAAARAVEELVARGHKDAVDLTLKVAKRIGSARRVDYDASAAVVRALAGCLDESRAFAPFLTRASAPNYRVVLALQESMESIVARQDFVDWLLASGVKSKAAAERSVATRILAHAKGESITPALARLARGKKPVDTARAAIHALGMRRTDAEAVDALRDVLRNAKDARAVDAMLTLHPIAKDDSAWESELIEVAERPALRAAALRLLADLGSERGLGLAIDSLGDDRWTIRAAAYAYCIAVRSKEAVPHLVERVDAESGRLREDLLDTLQSLTGRRFPSTEAWQAFWAREGDSFELAPRRDEPSRDRDRSSGETVTYYDMVLTSKRVAFVVDTSGSMRHDVRGKKGHSRLDEAKQQLRDVIAGMAKDVKFNVILFDTEVEAAFQSVTHASARARKKATKFVEGAESDGRGNLHDALRLAFDDPEVDTIYLLSDGVPSEGPLQEFDALADEVARWNLTQGVRIHCIAIGKSGKLVERLASESGGDMAVFE